MATRPLRRFAPTWLVVAAVLAATTPTPAGARIWGTLPAITKSP
jgi:hypothetical protein